jgi:hypothetical protein
MANSPTLQKIDLEWSTCPTTVDSPTLNRVMSSAWSRERSEHSDRLTGYASLPRHEAKFISLFVRMGLMGIIYVPSPPRPSQYPCISHRRAREV